MQKTDKRVLGTYIKSPSKLRKKKSEAPSKKVAYDVIYPSTGECQTYTVFLPPFWRDYTFIIYQLEIPQKKSAQHMISNTRLV